MPIQAQSADGVIHEFPDDTADEVVDRAMADYAQQQQHGAALPRMFGTPEQQLAMESGFISGTFPIVGPMLRGGAERVAAGIRHLMSGEPYEEELKAVQQYARGAEKKYPGRELGGELVGGVTGGAVAGLSNAGRWVLGLTPESTIGKIGAGALSGSLLGAGDVAVRGEGSPLIGGVVGGAAGGLAPLLAPAARYAVGKAGNLVRGVADPALEAERQVATAVERGQAGPAASRLTPQEFQTAAAAGAPVMVMDVAGEPGRSLIRGAGVQSPEAQATFNQAVQERFQGQAERFGDWFRQSFHYPDVVAQREGIDELARQVNKPAYQRAYAAGDKAVWSDELQRLMDAPALQSAMGGAIAKWKNFAVRDGYGALNSAFEMDNAGNLLRRGTGFKAYPNIQLWDYTTRTLQDIAREAPQGSQTRMLYNDLARMTKTELDRIVPEFGEARSGAARFFAADNALEAGEAAVTSKMPNEELRRNLAKMKPQERQMFQDGFVSQYIDILHSTKDHRSVLDKIGASGKARERLNLVLGRDRANELEGMVRVEGIMDFARKAAQGGSNTVQKMFDALAIGGTWAYEGFSTDPQAIGKALLAGGLTHGGGFATRRINERLANKVAELLTSRNLQDIERGMKMVARNAALRGALRDVDTALWSVAGRAVGGAVYGGHVRDTGVAAASR